MPVPIDVEAEIYFLTHEEGGRDSPAVSGYRPQFYYDGMNWDAPHTFPDVEVVNPGDTVRSLIGFLSPKKHFGKVYIGMQFQIREGDRIVGKGKITKIIELEKSAANYT